MNRNPSHGKVSAVLAWVVSLLAIVGTSKGIWDSTTYGRLLSSGNISENLYYGSIAQDMSMLLISAILLILSVNYLLKNRPKTLIAIIGLIWCEFYAFGLYVVQGQYTSIYVVYLLIFGLSIYGMLFGLLSLWGAKKEQVLLPEKTVRWIDGFLSLILVMMTPLWLMRMIPDIVANKPSETYGVFVMDLGIVFPAIGVIVAMLFRRKALGKILAGVALIKTCSLCLTWGFAEIYVPLVRELPMAMEMVGTSMFFTIVSGLLLIPYFRQLEIE